MILIPYHSTPATPPDGVKIWLFFFHRESLRVENYGHFDFGVAQTERNFSFKPLKFQVLAFAAGHADFKDFNDFSR